MVQRHTPSGHGTAPATDARRPLSRHRQRRAGRALHLGHRRAAVPARAVAVRAVPQLSAPLSAALRRTGQPHDRALLPHLRTLFPEGREPRSAGGRNRAGAAQQPALLRLHPRRRQTVRRALVRQRLGVQPLGVERLRSSKTRRQIRVRSRGRIQPQPPEAPVVYPLSLQLRSDRLRERVADGVVARRAHPCRRDPARRGGVRRPPRPARCDAHAGGTAAGLLLRLGAAAPPVHPARLSGVGRNALRDGRLPDARGAFAAAAGVPGRQLLPRRARLSEPDAVRGHERLPAHRCAALGAAPVRPAGGGGSADHDPRAGRQAARVRGRRRPPGGYRWQRTR